MKLAVLADIHANLSAFQAVIADIEQWQPDVVIIAGDIINRGPQPRACLELALRMRSQQGWHVIRGNHEGYILNYDRDVQAGHPPKGGRRALLGPIIWTHQEVFDLLSAIRTLPTQVTLATSGGAVQVYHASIHHDRDGLLPNHTRSELRAKIDPRAAVFCTAHTHMPFARQVEETLVVNVGSVGLPFDGDWRAAYARITLDQQGWHAQIVRVPYDREATLQAAREVMLPSSGPIAHIMLRELETARSLLFDFVPVYNEPVIAGVISLEEAVRRFLSGAELAA
ncbi:metallophosphoesterase family protein [Chloroflexus sp.]|uniref:metallophosphoesterase family protein n=1 Tax=Chloroflexus sp. TaxID=1904827 RepID=UPI0026315C4B|nr:metallophosphoesterase family protein [uncultured Chloroflexus sp.]